MKKETVVTDKLFGNNKLFLEPKVLHKLVCCDCGLVHDFKYRRTFLGAVLEMWRNGSETRRERKKREGDIKLLYITKKKRNETLPAAK